MAWLRKNKIIIFFTLTRGIYLGWNKKIEKKNIFLMIFMWNFEVIGKFLIIYHSILYTMVYDITHYYSILNTNHLVQLIATSVYLHPPLQNNTKFSPNTRPPCTVTRNWSQPVFTCSHPSKTILNFQPEPSCTVQSLKLILTNVYLNPPF